MSSHPPGPHPPSSPMPYFIVFAALLTLTLTTYLLSGAQLGAWEVPVALGIATAKTVLVALFFMHLWEQRAAYRLVLVVSTLFVLILMTFTLADVHTRFPLAAPQIPVAGTLDPP